MIDVRPGAVDDFARLDKPRVYVGEQVTTSWRLYTRTDILRYRSLSEPKHEDFWNHDTIGMVGTDGRGHVVSGCSTSGLAWKIPGRVGDSPLVGCGVYADDNVGAASATGDGDLMTNYCTSISIVHYMARGMSPQDACAALLQHVADSDPANRAGFVCVIAISNKGEVGAASMNSKFRLKYALWRDGQSQLLASVVMY